MANFNDLTLVERDDTPSLPMAGKMKIYAKTDKNIYKLDSDGIETLLGSAGPPAPDEGLFGWGFTGGDSRILSYYLPLTLIGNDFVEVSFGENHILAIKSDGTLWTLGSNTNGKTGLNTTSGITRVWTQVGTATDWHKVSAGNSHSAAIKTNGTLWIWGNRSNGRLGDGNTSGSTNVPTQVGSDTNWNSVHCGFNYTLAIKGGNLLSTGTNANAVTGLNTTSGNTTSFTVANSAETWKLIAAGNNHAIGVTTDGKLFSWGSNSSGATGLNTSTGTQLVPVQVGSDTDWDYCDCGGSVSAAIKNNGTLWTFGSRSNGKLGDGNISGQTLVPTQVGTDTDWELVKQNQNSSTAPNSNEGAYAIKNGELYATGSNLYGQLNQPHDDISLTTTYIKIAEGSNFVRISAGGFCAVAIRKYP